MIYRIPLLRTFITFFFISQITAFGNDGSYTKIEGSRVGAAMPINNDAITMIDENIKITVDRIEFIYNWLGEGMYPAHVRKARVVTKCAFLFKNDSSLRQEVLMGYPVTHPLQVVDLGNRGIQRRYAVKQPDTYFFDLRVRGKEAPYEYSVHESNPGLPKVGPYDGVYLFSVSFDADETIEIANTIIQEYEWVHSEKPSHRYILSTGLTWKKPIGHSRLAVAFPDIEPEILFFESLNYKPSAIQGTTFIFDFTDFSPNKDMIFQFDLKIQQIDKLGAALRRCHAAKQFNALKNIHDVVCSGYEFSLTAAGLDADFLRRMYFDCGNYYHAQNQFDLAAEMFLMSLKWSTPIMDWMKKKHSAPADKFLHYLSSLEGSHFIEEIINSKGAGLKRDTGIQAPSYYAAYNAACALARFDRYSENLLELTLVLGYPKKEYNWIRKDPDLELFRATQQKELDTLLKKYER